MTLLVSVPIEFPYPKPGYEIRVQSESCKTNFLQSENKFIAVYIDSLVMISIEKSEKNKKKSTGNLRQICLGP